jgi:hypothetical protein
MDKYESKAMAGQVNMASKRENFHILWTNNVIFYTFCPLTGREIGLTRSGRSYFRFSFVLAGEGSKICMYQNITSFLERCVSFSQPLFMTEGGMS